MPHVSMQTPWPPWMEWIHINRRLTLHPQMSHHRPKRNDPQIPVECSGVFPGRLSCMHCKARVTMAFALENHFDRGAGPVDLHSGERLSCCSQKRNGRACPSDGRICWTHGTDRRKSKLLLIVSTTLARKEPGDVKRHTQRSTDCLNSLDLALHSDTQRTTPTGTSCRMPNTVKYQICNTKNRRCWKCQCLGV